MTRNRLDHYLVARGLAATRSQADNYIKLGRVEVNGQIVMKSSYNIAENAVVNLTSPIKYVSRAALKLESVTDKFRLDFSVKVVLDVGSSTGGFTDYALQHGASRIIAVDVGKNQMDGSLRHDPRIELHEQTDIRNIKKLSTKIDYCLIDVSFISIRPVLKHLHVLLENDCMIIAMVKPQFEANNREFKHKGVIKNEGMRRKILKDFEGWARSRYKIIDKADSRVAGPKGNIERFYLLKSIQ
ncbi:MAG TPA: TlyA family RNA methyltransferase [Candidatus Saccharimonadales bacterium]|nr:TlyA family RNA methyltransferase [Candidatus Saccharimonadales bacterium]